MHKILTVAWREFLETVRTRAFFIGVVLMPAFIIGIIFGSEWLMKRAAAEEAVTRRIAVADRHGGAYKWLDKVVAAYNKQNANQPFELVPVADSQEVELRNRVLAREIYGYLIIPTGAVEGVEPVRFGRSDEQLYVGRTIDDFVREAVQRARFASLSPPLDYEIVAALQRPVPLLAIDPATGDERAADDTMARILTPFVFMFLLYMGTFGISMGLLTSVLEEKSSRVVEVLLAALSPTQLMAGKIVGMAAVGILLLAVWGGVGYAGASAKGVGNLVSATRMTYAVLYFIPGFLLMSALLAAIGAACNTLKEAQSMSSPLNIVNILPMVLWFQLSQFPNSALSIAFSYVPPITPFVMVLRICADPDIPMWQIVTTQLVLWASVVVAVWAAGKVFRVGVLMYGKPPTVRELLRWVVRA